MQRLTLCLVLIASLVSAISAQEQKEHEFRGVLKNKNLEVLTGVPLFFKKDDGKETAVSTDINGEFSIKLLPGNYEITVRKTLSEKFIAFISIAENRVNPNDVEFRIETNPICCGTSDEKPYPQILKAVKPPYPAAAIAVRAWGEVVVKTKIDKEGKVISAQAISGHPLLRTASVTAAKGFLFALSENDEVREVNLTFVFFPSQKEKENLKRFSSPYRIEIISDLVILNTIDNKSAKQKLPKLNKYFAPQIPTEANKVWASGYVVVNVKIDKNGKVISSKVESGHPLLRKASEEAAQKWLFSKDKTATEREVKLTFLFDSDTAKNKKDEVRFKKPYLLIIKRKPPIIY